MKHWVVLESTESDLHRSFFKKKIDWVVSWTIWFNLEHYISM